MKNILIPTDFTPASLNAVHAAAATYEGELKITLLHMLRMSEDIAELLFPSMRNKHQEMVTADFKEACEILENCYRSKIVHMHVKFGFGNTAAYLKNLLEGEKIDTIFTCPDIQLTLPSSRSIEMISLFKKTKHAMESIPYRKIKQEKALEDMAKLQGAELKIAKMEKDYATEE